MKNVLLPWSQVKYYETETVKVRYLLLHDVKYYIPRLERNTADSYTHYEVWLKPDEDARSPRRDVYGHFECGLKEAMVLMDARLRAEGWYLL